MTKPLHIEVQIGDALHQMLGEQLTLPKDIFDDERICIQCLGLGIRTAVLPFGVQGGEPGFPFGKTWLAICPDCFFGVQKVCPHCAKSDKSTPTNCCPAAQKDEIQRSADREAARVAKLPKVSYTEYLEEKNPDILYDDAHDCFIYDGDDLEAGNLYFGCVTTRNWEHPEADDVIERMKDRAEEQCEDGSEMLVISEEGEKALQVVLDEWAQKHVQLSDMYTVDRDRVVTVSWKDLGLDDPNEDDEEEAPPAPQV